MIPEMIKYKDYEIRFTEDAEHLICAAYKNNKCVSAPVTADKNRLYRDAHRTVSYEETDTYKIMVKTMKDNIDKNFNMKTE